MKTNYEERLTEEIESKIQEMESPSYEFPNRFSKKDYIFTAVVILVCLAGVFMSLAVYNPLSGEIHCKPLFYLTPTGCGFLGTGLLYFLLNQIPVVKAYTLRDREDITV